MPRFIKPLFLSLIYTFLSLHLAAQGSGCPQIDAGPNQTLACSQTCTNVTANVFDVGLTDSYTVGSIPHAPPIAYGAGGGTAVSVNTDDVWSGVINLPFPFCFYGATYNSCLIGSNGALNFNTSAAGGYHPWPFSASVPSAALSSAGNIFTPYHDIDPSEGGSVRWYLTGTAPCRVFIVSFNNIPHYDCTNLRSTHMVVLYETTNIIEVYVNNKSTCGGWNSGNTLIGIQNPAGTVGLTPPGRNTGSWSVNTPEAWQFKPSGAPIYSAVEWYEGGTLLGTGTTFNVCPSPPQSTYTARTTYTRCDGFQIIEQDDVTINYDAVTVSVSPSSTFTCAGSSTTITASSPSATNYLWTPGGMTTPSISVSPLSTTTYTVTATNSQNGCSETANATVSIAQPVSSACNVLYVTPTGSPTAAGSKADPMDLLTALEKGACNGTVVKMAVGTYTTDTTIQRVTSFITLEGGFDPAINWDKISTPGATRILRTATQSTSIVSGSGIDNEAGANPEVVAIAIANQSGFRFQDLTIEVSGLGGGTTYSGYNGVDIVGTRLQNCANYNYVRTQVIAGSASNGANQIWSIPATNGGNSTGVELLANGLNGVILNCNIQAGAGGNGGTGGGAAGSSNQLTLTGNGLSVNDPSFNLAGQEYIRMDDVSCTATNMDFSGTPSWTWLFGTGSTPPSAVGNLVTTQYNSLGRKTISYGSDNYEGFANIILDDQINPTFSTSAPFLMGQYRVCAGSTVDFTSTNGGVGYIYSWDLGGGATGQNIFNGTSFNSVSGVFDTPGIYTISLNYETNCCGLSAPTTLVLYVEEQPIAGLPGDQDICLGVFGGASLTATGLTTNGSVSWSPSTGLNASDTTTVIALPANTTDYTVTLSDSTGICTSSDTVRVNVIDLQLAMSSTSANCITLGTASVVVTGGSGSYSYTWSNGGGNTATLASLQPGLYTVFVNDNTLGCTDSASVNVPIGPGALTATLSATDILCAGENDGAVLASVSGGTPPYTYNWSPLGTSLTSTNTLDSITGLTQGTYTLDLVDDLGCTFSISVDVEESGPLVFVVDSAGNTSCSGVNDGFIEISTDGGERPYSFTWNTGMPAIEINDAVVASNLSPGTYVLTVVDDFGCTDSISLTLNSGSGLTSIIDTVICYGENYVFPGGGSVNLFMDTNAIDSLVSLDGCDSVVFTNVTVPQLSLENMDTALCQGQSLTVNGTTYSATGIYNDTLRYVASGCDSVQFVVDLQIDSVDVVTIDTTLCQGQSLTVNGMTYTATGVYNDTASYVLSGCDSIQFVIDLQIDSVQVENIDTTLCQGQSLTVNGTTYSATGIYNDTLRYAASGCDSIQFVIDLQIDSVQVENIDTTLCQGQSLTVNGTTYTATGIYNDTARYAASGCDSIQFVIDLQIDSVQIESIDTTLCQGQSLIVNGTTYSATGIYNDTLHYAASGCDSVQLVIDLQIETVQVENIDTALCQGQSLTVNGTTYSATGIYNDTLRYVASGCDSVQFVIDLQIDSVQVENIDTTLCQGQSLTVNGTTYTATGVYNDTASYVLSGCDSIQFVIDLQIDSVDVETIDTTLCQGQSLIVNGTTYSATGVYNDTLRYAASACDSVQFVIDLQVDSILVENIDTTICQGQSLTVNGTTYAATGIYNDTLRYAASGCDSVQFLVDLSISPLPTVLANTSEPDSAACINTGLSLFGSGTPGVTYTWDNGVVDNVNFNLPLGTSTYIVTGEDALGCISADTISLEGYPIYDIALNASICEDESYTLPDGSVVNTAGVYPVNLNTINGCDSVITTTLEVNLLGLVNPLEDIVVCDGLSQTIEVETQNITSFEWFINDGSGSQSLLGNTDYLDANTAALSFNLDTTLHQNVYTVIMTDACGNTFTEGLNLEVYSPHPIDNPVSDTTFCLHEIEPFTIDYNGTDYQWSNGDFGPSILVETTGEYIVNFIENGTNCLLSDTINITIEDCIGNCVVLAPTGFSPNASGENDIFRVVTTCEEEFSSFSFAVFDRWGQLVYSTNDWREGWDGTFRGRNAEIGTYTYTLSYVKALTNKKETLSGNVTLIR